MGDPKFPSKHYDTPSHPWQKVRIELLVPNEEKKRMLEWNLTAKTIMSVDDWILFFKKVNYEGDYYWFIP